MQMNQTEKRISRAPWWSDTKEKFKLLKDITEEIESDLKKAEKMLKIICIYQTNAYDDGLRIKTARINHSCQPNAVALLEINEVRAISDIKVGPEPHIPCI